MADILKPPPIYVTRPVLPPLEDFLPYLRQIWNSKTLTNSGPFHTQFEEALCAYLGVEHIALFTNGTLALITALQALGLKGEVITTPYSFVGTSHALLWNGLKPVFADIDPVSLNLDPDKLEAAITSETTAIMPVHCYGNPCDTVQIQTIANQYGLKVIYDAAHAFAVDYLGRSLLRFGDMSVLSFHATKVFTTFEGGAVVCPDAETKRHLDHLKNFGFIDEVTVEVAGINGKLSEFNAALGLLQLKGFRHARTMRQAIDARYRAGLANSQHIHCHSFLSDSTPNYAYFPILVKRGYPLGRDGLYRKLQDNGIFARRYFYPLISDFPMYSTIPSAARSNLPIATRISSEVICLPIFPDLSFEQVDYIIDLIAN